jgi:signal peptide peptidase SppA
VASLMLRIDSPGGSVAGIADLADLIHQASQAKPVYAFIEDCGASAAYWLASQCRFVWANTSARVGGIGVYGVVRDFSKAFESAGIRTHVIRAGAFKGAGVTGTPVTDAQLAEAQREIDAINELFVKAVSRGRRTSIDRVRALADGRVHIGEHARSLGLIDAVGSLDQVVANLNAPPAASPGRTAAARWRDLIHAEEKRLLNVGYTPMVARSKAIAAVDKAFPTMRQEMIEAANKDRLVARGVQRRDDIRSAVMARRNGG